MYLLQILQVGILFFFFQINEGDIRGTNPEQGECLCVYNDSVKISGTACANETLGYANFGDCFIYTGNKSSCPDTEEFQVGMEGDTGWIDGQYLVESVGYYCEPLKSPDDEFRGLWVATVNNIDFPSTPSLNTTQQQEELLNYINLMQDLKMNAMVFQIRPAGDAFYASTLEPWSKYLTGAQGVPPSPFWDPLEFAITECHRRGIEVHAWLNPYRANLQPNWQGLDPKHMAIKFREYAYPYGNYLWMDPGATQVQQHTYDVILDVVTRYDVDGVHWDDYFYPYPVAGSTFPDNATYMAYLEGGGNMSLADWRRDNVNRLVERVYADIKFVKKSVKFGISPFGLYRPGHPEGQPDPIRGFDQYSQLYADPKLWLQRGWVDYMAPQLYWKIAPPAQSYYLLLEWWLSVNTMRRHMYFGNGVYRIAPREQDWPVEEIERQVNLTRRFHPDEAKGNILFSAKFFRDNIKNVTDILEKGLYRNEVTIPVMPWLQETSDHKTNEWTA